MKELLITVACLALLPTLTSVAQANEVCAGPQIGTWKLRSFVSEDLQTHARRNPFGAHPTGYLFYGRDCRMYAIVVADNRKPPASSVASDTESIELYRGLISYSGTYEIEGDTVKHHIDASWNQSWTGTIQVRRWKIAEDVLRIQTLPAASVLTGKRTTSVLVWVRAP